MKLSRRALLTLLASLAAGPACDNREAFHAPEPGLERMLQQHRGDPYGESEFFGDGRAMRTPPPFTRSREAGDPHSVLETGRAPSGYTSTLPVPLTRPLLERGHAEFERVCATCHGLLGDGVSVVAQKMELRPPPSLHEARIEALPRGRVFEIISRGYGLMPSLAAQVTVEDRWAVIAYLDALRASRAVPVESLPAPMRAELQREAP